MAQPKAKSSSKAVVKDQNGEQDFRHKPLMHAQIHLFLSGENADCKIVCQGYEWNVHSSIILPRCEYLRKAFSGFFQEGQTKSLNWDCEDPHAVEGLLLYLYILEYPNWMSMVLYGYVTNSNGAEAQKKSAAPVEDRATKYLQGSNETAINVAGSSRFSNLSNPLDSAMSAPKQLKTVVSGYPWQSAIKFFDIAERFGVTDLRNLSVNYLKLAVSNLVGKSSYVDLLKEVWGLQGEGSEELDDAVIRAICQNMRLLLSEPRFLPMLERSRDLEHLLLEEQQGEIERLRGPRGR